MTDNEAAVLARHAGVDVDYARVSDDRIVIKYSEGISFETLSKVSELFRTTRINLGIEHGCESDPSADPYTVIWTS